MAAAVNHFGSRFLLMVPSMIQMAMVEVLRSVARKGTITFSSIAAPMHRMTLSPMHNPSYPELWRHLDASKIQSPFPNIVDHGVGHSRGLGPPEPTGFHWEFRGLMPISVRFIRRELHLGLRMGVEVFNRSF